MNILESIYRTMFESQTIPSSINDLDKVINQLIIANNLDGAKQQLHSFKLKYPSINTDSILIVPNSSYRTAYYHSPIGVKKEKLKLWLNDYIQHGYKAYCQPLLDHIRKYDHTINVDDINLNNLSVGQKIIPNHNPAPGVKVSVARITTNTNNIAVIINDIIDNIEQGYADPVHMNLGSAFANSGETMYGIDKKNGTDIQKYSANAWNEFWKTIASDKAHNPTLWKHNYMGGDLAPRLRELAVSMVSTMYQNLSSTAFTPATKSLVESDGRLLYTFVDAIFNGNGFFNKFAQIANQFVASKQTNTTLLTSKLLGIRRQMVPLIANRVPKITASVGIA